MITHPPIDTTAAIAWYRRNRARTEAIFDLIDPAAYYSRPIALRNPIVFYEGHLPAFSVIAFLRRGLGLPPVDARAREAVRARDRSRAGSRRAAQRRVDGVAVARRGPRVRARLRRGDHRRADGRSTAGRRRVRLEGLYTALEHEAMHQETLLYMWHRLPYEQKRAPEAARYRGRGRSGARRRRCSTAASVRFRPEPPRSARIGRRSRSAGTTSSIAHDVHVPAFDDRHAARHERAVPRVHRRRRLQQPRELWSEEGWEWIQAERVQHPAFWVPADDARRSARHPRDIRLPRVAGLRAACLKRRAAASATWPVYVSHAEASAYARWKGRRLMTEAGVPPRRRRGDRGARRISPASIRFRSDRIRRPRALRASTI